MPDIQQYSVSIKFKTEGSEATEAKVKKLEEQISKLKSSKSTDISKSIGLDKMGTMATKIGGLIKGAALGVGISAISKLGKSFGTLTKQTSDYIETVNLFRSSMGEFAEDAKQFYNRAEVELGLDPKVIMDSISSFQNLSEGIGIASDRAYIMSKNLTQLSGDLSSFANISFEDAQKKLLSGFSGQVQPLRKYGIALDQASLQETAYSLGLEQKVKNMTKAQKTELIYYQIMKSTQKMQGDLGRSIISPANALRVIQTEFTRLGRAVGSIFIPMMMKIIPVVRIVTQVLTSAAEAIASFFGFKMQNYESDLSSVGNLLTGMSDGIDGIGDSAEGTAKKLNKMLMPFDELNNITSSDSSGSGAGAGELSGGSLGIELPQYDMFASVSENMNETISNIKLMLSKIFEPFKKSWKTYGEEVINSAKYGFEGIVGLVNSIGTSLVTVWTNGNGEKKIGIFLKMWTDIFNTIGNISNALKNAWNTDDTGTKIIQNISDALTNLYAILGETYEVFEEFTRSEDFQKFATQITRTIETLTSTWKKWTDKLKEIWDSSGKETLSTVIESFSKMGELISLVIQKLEPVIKFFMDNVGEEIKKVINEINNIWTILNGLLDFVIGVFTGDWERAWKGIYNIFVTLVDNILNKVTTVFNQFVNIMVTPIRTAYNKIKEVIENIKGLFNFSWKLPDLKIPHMWWSTQDATGWAANVLKALNLPAQLPKLNISWYAEGGFPEIGQLFVANESGPELIGNIGSKTAVANQDQITTAIATATYNAIRKALAENKSSDKPQLIQVNVGDKEIYRGYGQYKDEQNNMLGVNT